jgi:glycosyltransferase involved in cell wall biosynthesis
MRLSNPREIKILIYGSVSSRDYRSLILIKFLQDCKYCISQVYPGFYRTNKKLTNIFLVELFIKAAFADVIYLLPMNVKFIRSAIWAAKIFNKKLIVEMYISLYDSLVRDREKLKYESKEAKLCREKDILALTKSNYIIHTSSQEMNHWEKILGIKIDRNKVFISPNCNTPSLILKRSFMQDGILKICWWGSFIPLHGLDNILQAMQILKQREVPFTCNLFGVDNHSFPQYAEKIQLAQLELNVFLRKDLSFTDGSLPQYLVDNCDLALGIFGNTDKALNVVPNKLTEALSMGIPTLTMNSPALKEFFDPEADFWTCEPVPESIAESILIIIGGTAYPVDWEQTRRKAQNTFSVARYQEVVSQVLGRATNNLSAGETSVVDSGVFATPQTGLNQVER